MSTSISTSTSTVASAPESRAHFHLPSYLLGLVTALAISGLALFLLRRPEPAAMQLQAPPSLPYPRADESATHADTEPARRICQRRCSTSGPLHPTCRRTDRRCHPGCRGTASTGRSGLCQPGSAAGRRRPTAYSGLAGSYRPASPRTRQSRTRQSQGGKMRDSPRPSLTANSKRRLCRPPGSLLPCRHQLRPCVL